MPGRLVPRGSGDGRSHPGQAGERGPGCAARSAQRLLVPSAPHRSGMSPSPPAPRQSRSTGALGAERCPFKQGRGRGQTGGASRWPARLWLIEHGRSRRAFGRQSGQGGRGARAMGAGQALARGPGATHPLQHPDREESQGVEADSQGTTGGREGPSAGGGPGRGSCAEGPGSGRRRRRSIWVPARRRISRRARVEGR